MRLTLEYEPTEIFRSTLKYSYSEYVNEAGGSAWSDHLCPEGRAQPTAVPTASTAFRFFQAANDRKVNGNTAKVNVHPDLRAGLPRGYDDGVAGLEQDTQFLSLRMDWEVGPAVSLTSITGWVDLDHWELDDYSYGAGVFIGLHNNVYESVSQELRLATNFDGPVGVRAGYFYQTIEQEFDAYQNAFNLAILPNIFGPAYALVGGDPAALLIGPDPVTGNAYDYNKHHFLDTDVHSGFVALDYDIMENTQLTAGVRYTDEAKTGRIEIPYLHAAARLFRWGAPPVIKDGLRFDDSNVSPEVALNHFSMTT